MNLIPLIKGEIFKIQKSKSFILSLMLVTVVVIVSAFISFNSYTGDWRINLEKKVNDDWTLLSNINQDDMAFDIIQKEIILNTYHLTHDIPPSGSGHLISYIEKYAGITSLIGLIIMFYASNMVSKENTWGTLKMMLLRPYNKEEILISKYISLLYIGIVMYIFTFILLNISGVIIYGLDTISFTSVALNTNGELFEQNAIIQIIKRYLYSFLLLSAYTALAIMISVIFNNSNLSIVITVFTFIFGGSLSAYFSEYTWANFLFFSNTGLDSFGVGQTLSLEPSPVFSTTIILLYTIVFIFCSMAIFKKRQYV
ncbi:ABC transporter permease subunit [Sporosarcina saromensis]|uniref:ABC transporter permease subunit n=1 Tax=Sporosarcina saromensis TaxID=359365 RepID=A0ABU4GFL1_9BACL|nr:ABC transporter permease subunit [Sporosarcina saromensis]MDW0115075.1 ABC transporter permease subunit [Sporosarcina saromensis]